MRKMANGLLERMLVEAEQKLIPFGLLIEITHRCNFDCVHCYQAHQHHPTRAELTTADWIAVLDQARALGTFFLTISGGEMLVRRDWFAIAQHGRALGLALRMYSNGALITEQVADQMATLDPIAVEVSVYSHQSAVFEDVTQRRGSFARTLQGIKLLRERNLPVSIKTPIMQQNIDHYQALIALAEELGAYYSFDPTLFPRNDGDLTPLQYQVDLRQLAVLYQDPALYDAPCTISGQDFEAIMNAAPCGSGRRICVVDPYGEVYGCLQMLRSNGNVREQGLAEIWWHGATFQETRSKLRKDLVRCAACPGPPYCHPCMGLSLMEHGSIVGKSQIACRQNQLRYQRAQAEQGIVVAVPESAASERYQAPAQVTPLTLLSREQFRATRPPAPTE